MRTLRVEATGLINYSFDQPPTAKHSGIYSRHASAICWATSRYYLINLLRISQTAMGQKMPIKATR